MLNTILTINDKREDSYGDMEVKAICSSDASSFALQNIELTVRKDPSGKGGHLEERQRNTPLVCMFQCTWPSDGLTLTRGSVTQLYAGSSSHTERRKSSTPQGRFWKPSLRKLSLTINPRVPASASRTIKICWGIRRGVYASFTLD